MKICHDEGFVVYSKLNNKFWSGLDWVELRCAKIYHSRFYAEKVIEKFPNYNCELNKAVIYLK